MKDRYNLIGHSNSSTKELHLIEELDNYGIYRPVAKWPDSSEASYRIGYDSAESGILDFIDFDGGPFISAGYEVEPGVKVERIIHDNFKNIRVIIK